VARGAGATVARVRWRPVSLNGNWKVPASRRLYQIAQPSRSQYGVFTRSLLRCRTRTDAPRTSCSESGARPSSTARCAPPPESSSFSSVPSSRHVAHPSLSSFPPSVSATTWYPTHRDATVADEERITPNAQSRNMGSPDGYQWRVPVGVRARRRDQYIPDTAVQTTEGSPAPSGPGPVGLQLGSLYQTPRHGPCGLRNAGPYDTGLRSY